MLLWTTYSCDGGKDHSKLHNPYCSCTGPQGLMTNVDIPGCGGWVEIECHEGCITIHKILYSCEKKPTPNEKQMEMIRKRCQGKEYCKIKPSIQVYQYAIQQFNV